MTFAPHFGPLSFLIDLGGSGLLGVTDVYWGDDTIAQFGNAPVAWAMLALLIGGLSWAWGSK